MALLREHPGNLFPAALPSVCLSVCLARCLSASVCTGPSFPVHVHSVSAKVVVQKEGEKAKAATVTKAHATLVDYDILYQDGTMEKATPAHMLRDLRVRGVCTHLCSMYCCGMIGFYQARGAFFFFFFRVCFFLPIDVANRNFSVWPFASGT